MSGYPSGGSLNRSPMGEDRGWECSDAVMVWPSSKGCADNGSSFIVIDNTATRKGPSPASSPPRAMPADAASRADGDTGAMSTYRLRTPDQTIDLGDFETAQEALEAAVDRQPELKPEGGFLEVLVGDQWHPVDIEGDMP